MMLSLSCNDFFQRFCHVSTFSREFGKKTQTRARQVRVIREPNYEDTNVDNII